MNNTTAIVAVALGSLIAAVAVTIWHPGDNAVLITIIFGSGVSTIAGLLGLVKSAQNSADLEKANTKLSATDSKLNTLAITVDGRLTQLLEAKTDAASSAGELKGQQDERYRAALLAQPPVPSIDPLPLPPSEPLAGPGTHQ